MIALLAVVVAALLGLGAPAAAQTDPCHVHCPQQCNPPAAHADPASVAKCREQCALAQSHCPPHAPVHTPPHDTGDAMLPGPGHAHAPAPVAKSDDHPAPITPAHPAPPHAAPPQHAAAGQPMHPAPGSETDYLAVHGADPVAEGGHYIAPAHGAPVAEAGHYTGPAPPHAAPPLTYAYPGPQPAAPPAYASVPPAAAPATGPTIATRLFVKGDFQPPADFGAVATLIFPAVVGPDRLLAVCRAFVGGLAYSGGIAAAHPDWEQMVTLWPVVAGSTALDPANQAVNGAQAVRSLCPDAARDYDYDLADQWRVAARQAGFDAGSGAGPFLIAWAPARAIGRRGVPVLFYDLSLFTTPAQLSRAMGIWRTEIETNPQLWAGGWDSARFSLFAATLADHYGQQVFDAIKLLPFADGN